MKNTNWCGFDWPRTTRIATIIEPTRRPNVYGKHFRSLHLYEQGVRVTYDDEVLDEVEEVEGDW